MPQRIQRKRTKGWRMPENTVYVARPSKWGNPFQLDDFWDAGYSGGERVAREAVVSAYWQWMKRERFTLSWPSELVSWCVSMQANQFMPNPVTLRGKNLACWCPLDQSCHADVLLELANRGADTTTEQS